MLDSNFFLIFLRICNLDSNFIFDGTIAGDPCTYSVFAFHAQEKDLLLHVR